MDDLTPEQLQVFWTIKELFPAISGDAIRANAHHGIEHLAEMVLAGDLPEGYEFVHDSDAAVVGSAAVGSADAASAASAAPTTRPAGGLWGAFRSLVSSITRIADVFVPPENEDAEPALTEEERARLEQIIDVIDREMFERASAELPHACFSWILLNADFGLQFLAENQHCAPPRKQPRRDRKGVTHLVMTRLHHRSSFECAVCFDSFSSSLAVSCTPPVVPRGRWAAAAATHSFCADCVRGQAGAAVEQNVIVPSGIGLKCMQPACANVLIRSHVEQVLDGPTRAALEPHFAHEALTAAGVQTESCPRCDFTVIMAETPDERQVFACLKYGCRYEYCRRCNRPWDERHASKTCDELDYEEQQAGRSVLQRLLAWLGAVPAPPPTAAAMRQYKELAERLTAMTMHKCPRCSKAYLKSDACNYMTCPCGQTSCYVCGEAIDNYAHFKSERNPDKQCSLWDDPTVAERAAAAEELKRRIATAANKDVARTLRLLL